MLAGRNFTNLVERFPLNGIAESIVMRRLYALFMRRGYCTVVSLYPRCIISRALTLHAHGDCAILNNVVRFCP